MFTHNETCYTLVLQWRDGDPGRVAELDGLTLIKLDYQPTQAPRAQNPLRLLPVVQHRYSQDRGCLKQPLVVIVLSEEEKNDISLDSSLCSLHSKPSTAFKGLLGSLWLGTLTEAEYRRALNAVKYRMLLSELAKLDSDAQEDSSALCHTRTRGRGEKRDGRASGSGGGGGAGVRERAGLPQ
ncbi:hypothetical protein K438DRAFT_1763881 [Mycena galopus ATCC 62051]|nr:hypothetical protein K438DRAFT_1763881 [Mycena galopus ATCC 62051]